MPSTYTTSLRIEKIATGEKSGTWGSVTNDQYDLFEQAIAGVASVTHDDSADYTLTANNGLSDEARNLILEVGGSLTATRNLVCPAAEKFYIVKNSTGQSIVVKTSGGTGVTITDGVTRMVYCDGTNVVDAVTDLPSGTAIGGATIVTLSDSQTLTSKTIDSASNTITIDLSEATVTGTLAEFNTALSDGTFAEIDASQTLTNKTIDSASNTLTVDLSEATVTGTLSEFNTALSDGSFASLAGAETLVDKTLTSTSNGDITINPNGTGNVIVGNYEFDADQAVGAGQDNYVLKYDNGTGLISLEAEAAGGISELLDDTSPQLGGDLDLNTHGITLPGATVTDITGADTLLVSGTAGTNGDLAVWNVDGDLVDGPTPPTGDIVGTSDTQTLTGKTLTSAKITDNIQHSAGAGNNIAFGSGTQDFQTSSTSRMDISNTGVRFGGANARITTVYDSDTLSQNSATALATQQSIKAYVDSNAGSVDVQTFTGDGTWNKPTGATYVLVRAWGAGGGGGGADATNTGGGGGGGGSYHEALFAASALGSSETVTIGTGGSGGGTNVDGGVGGSTTFGSHVTAYGGGGGNDGGGGGGGGGALGAGEVGTITNGGQGGDPDYSLGGATGRTGQQAPGLKGNPGEFGGAGGGGGGDQGENGGDGGDAVYGGASGAGGGDVTGGSSGGSGGTSLYGGNGGNAQQAGVQPGGGGGGGNADGGSGAAGGDGQVIVVSW